MRIGLINIGDELLAGKILNTNARDLALWLAELGHELAFALTLPDDVRVLANTFRRIVDETPRVPAFPSTGAPPMTSLGMLLLSGGLGPTRDDLTRAALAAYLGVPLEPSARASAWLAERLDRKVEADDPQVQVPRGALPLRNPAGTACGLRFDRNECAVFAFPGVPSEFRALFQTHCRPLLEQRDARLLRRRVVTFGLSEGRQRALLKDFSVPPPFRFSSLPSDTEVSLSLEGFVPLAESAAHEETLDRAWAELLALLPPENIVDAGGAALPDTVFGLLRDRGATVTIAESCTAGGLGHLLTEVPGSSAVFREGYLTYADEAKTRLLGVPAALLARHGAVSEPVARAMARGARAAAGSDYAISVTGIAGPDGASPEKPVGRVYIAVIGPQGEDCAEFTFKGDRESVRRKGARTALNQLRLLILKDLRPQK